MGNSPGKRSSSARELERFSKPTGLYASCPWDVKTVRKLILSKQIAPRFPGKESQEKYFNQECPICFMFYPGNLNVSKCCKKPICSECYLQMRPPRKSICCPFCNRDGFAVEYTGSLVVGISSIYNKRELRHSHSSNDKKPTHKNLLGDDVIPPAPTSAPPVMHCASVKEREQLQQSLREQLHIDSRRIVSARHSSANTEEYQAAVNFYEATSQVEELMLLEAIRRSMRDLAAANANAPNKQQSPGDAEHHAEANTSDDHTMEREDQDEDALQQRARQREREVATSYSAHCEAANARTTLCEMLERIVKSIVNQWAAMAFYRMGMTRFRMTRAMTRAMQKHGQKKTAQQLERLMASRTRVTDALMRPVAVALSDSILVSGCCGQDATFLFFNTEEDDDGT